MEQELIVKALERSCGNKNWGFQVVVQEDQLHIYVNRKANYQPDYIILEKMVAAAIASLKLDSLDAVWLYCRQLGKLEPDWQISVELPTQINSESEVTLGNTENLDTEIDFPQFEDFEDSIYDTGLLRDRGMVHGTFLQAEIINTLFSLPPVINKFLLPVVWTLSTVILIVLGIIGNNSHTVVASEQIPALCSNTIGSVNYCHLAVNLAGEKTIARSPRSLFPLTELTETAAIYGCERYANLKAQRSANLVNQQTSVIYSYGEKVFPHIYVVEVEQKKAKRLGNIKVGCVYTTGTRQRSPKLLAADVIPLNWPAQSYQRAARLNTNLSLGIYTNLISLGLNTVFAALGIAIACWLNLGFKINQVETIYLVAFILGIVQLITASLPALGLVSTIAVLIMTIFVVSLLIKDFQINWNYGYPLVTVSMFTIVAVQLLLYGLCWGLINSLI
ncbi:MAG: hypothetical protein ACFCU7_02720 [Pleurocapsa sp.]